MEAIRRVNLTLFRLLNGKTKAALADETSALNEVIQLTLRRNENRAVNVTGGNQVEPDESAVEFESGYNQRLDRVRSFTASREISELEEGLAKGVDREELENIRGPTPKVRRVSDATELEICKGLSDLDPQGSVATSMSDIYDADFNALTEATDLLENIPKEAQSSVSGLIDGQAGASTAGP